MATFRLVFLAPLLALFVAGCAGNCDPNATQGLAAGACLAMGDDGGFSGRKKAKQQELADLKLQNVELKGEIGEAETDLYAVQQRRQKAERRQAEQQRELDRLKRQEAASSQRNVALEAEIAQLEKNLAQSKAQTTDLGAEEKNLERKLTDLRRKEDALQEDIDVLSASQ